MVAFPEKPRADVLAIKHALIGQLQSLVDCLFASRKIERMAQEYRVGNRGSLSVRRINGAFCDHETGECGDILGLIQYSLKTDFKGALAWAQAFIGKNPKCIPLSKIQKASPRQDNRAELRRQKALGMMKRSLSITGTLAEKYLREHRGIELQLFPADLGYIESAYNYTAKGFYPALIAPMRNSQDGKVAVHLTFLDPATAHKLTGEDIKSRLIFGPCRGAVIRLGEATERLALCEGLEDGLSIMQSSPEWPVWVTGGTSGLRSVQIPSHVREILICSDRDEAGTQAANALAARLATDGKKVSIALPPEGVKDFNDLLRKAGGHV